MPILSSNDQSIGIAIQTTADTKGAEDAAKSVDKLTGTVEDAGKKTTNFAEQFSGGLKKAAIATGVAGAALTVYAKSATDAVVGLVSDSKQLARETGGTVEESSKLLAVTKRLGLGIDQTSSSFGILSKQITAARESSGANSVAQEEARNKIVATKIAISDLTGEIKKNGDKNGELHNKLEALNIDLKKYQLNLDGATSPLQKINVATKNADGSTRSFNDILLDVSDRFKAMPNGAEKSALAMELFGRSGKDMIKVLNLGSTGIKDMEAQADKLGVTLNSKNIAAVTKYVQANKDLAASNEALKISVGTMTAPVLADFYTGLNNMLQGLLQTDGIMKDLTLNTLAFGGPVLSASAAVLGFAANLGTVITSLGAFKAASMAAINVVRTGFMSLLGLLATPVTLVVAGALADLALVYTAIQKVRGALSDMNAARDAKVKAAEGANEGIADATAKYKAGKINKTQYQAMLKSYTDLTDSLVEKRATGGPVSPGQAYAVGDNPDGSWNDTTELFVPRQSGTIIPASQARGMAGGGGSIQITIQQASFNTADAVNSFFDLQNRNSVLASKGLATIGNA